MSETTAKKVVALKGLAEDLYAEIRHLRQRLDRAERILAALREPSGAVVDAAQAKWEEAVSAWAHWPLNFAIRAAVAAAEREEGA